MKKLLWVFPLLILMGGLFVTAQAEHVTIIPEGMESAAPDPGVLPIPCDVLLRYDDGTDDTPGSGSTLGGPSAPYQYLGIIATPPADVSYEVQSAAFWSEFWVTAGVVNVEVFEVSDPTNATSAMITVNAGGTWEVEFDTPICVGPGSDFAVMLCPNPGVWGVTGEDLSAPDGRSYWSNSTQGCFPTTQFTGQDLLIWACVTPCEPTPTEESSWGSVKSLYR
jgi:hypothetical protein